MEMTDKQLTTLLGRVVAATHPDGAFNKGNVAGLFKNLDFGTHDTPVDVTADTLFQAAGSMMIFLQQNLQWFENEMALLLPQSIVPVIEKHPKLKIDNPPNTDQFVLPERLLGFNLLVYKDSMLTSDAHEYVVACRVLPEDELLTDKHCAVAVWRIH